MRIPSAPRRATVGFNTTPMIDVVFLLIIFFMVSSHLARQESQLPVELPPAVTGKVPVADQPRRIIVSIGADGAMALSGEPVGAEQLLARLQVEHRQHADCQVRIRADRRVAYQRVEPVLLACAQAGIWRVTFAVKRDQARPSATEVPYATPTAL